MGEKIAASPPEPNASPAPQGDGSFLTLLVSRPIQRTMPKGLPILDPTTSPQSAGSGGEAFSDAESAEARRKLLALQADLKDRVAEGVLVAFSGGLDSAFLLWAAGEAVKSGPGRVVALTTTSPSTPARDKEDARAFGALVGVDHLWEESQEMFDFRYARNDRDRCYHCKTELFRIAGEVARDQGLRWLLYGYNASDHGDDRPGHIAAQEAEVLTPLSDAGLTKGEIRHLMMEAGLPLSGKPASPCLSSRIMTGIEITTERLRDVEELEGILRDAGVSTLRVRICRDELGSPFLRVEVPTEEMDNVLRCREELQRVGIDKGYRWVTLDLGGYRMGGGVS